MKIAWCKTTSSSETTRRSYVSVLSPRSARRPTLIYTLVDCGIAEQRSCVEQEAVEAADTGVSRSGAFGSESLRHRQQPLVILSFLIGLSEGASK